MLSGVVLAVFVVVVDVKESALHRSGSLGHARARHALVTLPATHSSRCLSHTRAPHAAHTVVPVKRWPITVLIVVVVVLLGADGGRPRLRPAAVASVPPGRVQRGAAGGGVGSGGAWLKGVPPWNHARAPTRLHRAARSPCCRNGGGREGRHAGTRRITSKSLPADYIMSPRIDRSHREVHVERVFALRRG